MSSSQYSDLPDSGAEDEYFAPVRHGRAPKKATATTDIAVQTASAPGNAKAGPLRMGKKSTIQGDNEPSKKRKRKSQIPETTKKQNVTTRASRIANDVDINENYTTCFTAYTNPDAIKAELSLLLEIRDALKVTPAFKKPGSSLLYLHGLDKHIALLSNMNEFLGQHHSPGPPKLNAGTVQDDVQAELALARARALFADAKPTALLVVPEIDFTDEHAMSQEVDVMDKLLSLLNSDAQFQSSKYYKNVNNWRATCFSVRAMSMRRYKSIVTSKKQVDRPLTEPSPAADGDQQTTDQAPNDEEQEQLLAGFWDRIRTIQLRTDTAALKEMRTVLRMGSINDINLQINDYNERIIELSNKLQTLEKHQRQPTKNDIKDTKWEKFMSEQAQGMLQLLIDIIDWRIRKIEDAEAA